MATGSQHGHMGRVASCYNLSWACWSGNIHSPGVLALRFSHVVAPYPAINSEAMRSPKYTPCPQLHLVHHPCPHRGHPHCHLLPTRKGTPNTPGLDSAPRVPVPPGLSRGHSEPGLFLQNQRPQPLGLQGPSHLGPLYGPPRGGDLSETEGRLSPSQVNLASFT